MPRLIDIPRCSSTTVANGLSRQILAEMNVLVPGVLVDCSDLNIAINSLQFPLLQQRAKDALARAIRNRDRTLQINSGYRTCAQQFLLRRWLGHCGIERAAIPGNSNHESGLGLDIAGHAGWKPYLESQSWIWKGLSDDVHFDYRGGGVSIGNVGIKAFQTLWNRNFPDQPIAADGVYGPETEAKLGISPAEGFNNEAVSKRILRLMSPLMQGGDVELVQIRLKARSLLADNEIDGLYGEITKAAVTRFQEAEGLEIDGVVGDETYERLGIQ